MDTHGQQLPKHVQEMTKWILKLFMHHTKWCICLSYDQITVQCEENATYIHLVYSSNPYTVSKLKINSQVQQRWSHWFSNRI